MRTEQHQLLCCEEIERLIQKPSYYYLYNYEVMTVEEDKKNVCPNCGEVWLLEGQVLEHFDFKCSHCHLLSNLTYQS